MLKPLLSLIFVLLVSRSPAQITKGNWMLGGSGTFSMEQQKTEYGYWKSTQLNLSPNIAYFFADKFAAGLKPRVNSQKNNINGTTNSTSWLGIGPLFRYYVLNEQNFINIFADASYIHSVTSGKYHQNLFLFSAGPEFYFNSSVGLELALNYQFQNYSSSPRSAKTFFVSLGFQIHLEKEEE